MLRSVLYLFIHIVVWSSVLDELAAFRLLDHSKVCVQ